MYVYVVYVDIISRNIAFLRARYGFTNWGFQAPFYKFSYITRNYAIFREIISMFIHLYMSKQYDCAGTAGRARRVCWYGDGHGARAVVLRKRYLIVDDRFSAPRSAFPRAQTRSSARIARLRSAMSSRNSASSSSPAARVRSLHSPVSPRIAIGSSESLPSFTSCASLSGRAVTPDCVFSV